MSFANQHTYLRDLCRALRTQWPQNRTINIVCHGHSVPAGYAATPFVDTFNAYPHLLHVGLKERYPYAVINVIVSAVGGENSECGAARFERDVLAYHPDLITIDYGLNDRLLGTTKAAESWRKMIEQARRREAKVILLTPTPDSLRDSNAARDPANDLEPHASQIRSLASEYEVGLADSLAAFDVYCQRGGALGDLLNWVNHPSRQGHKLVAQELLRWFPLPVYEDVI